MNIITVIFVTLFSSLRLSKINKIATVKVRVQYSDNNGPTTCLATKIPFNGPNKLNFVTSAIRYNIQIPGPNI